MSQFKEFFAGDFAKRCEDLLTKFWGPAKVADREVTLLIAVAAAGLVCPLERLWKGASQPELDRQKFAIERGRLQTQLGLSMNESALFTSTNRKAWTGGLLKSAEDMPDSWPEYEKRLQLPDKTPLSDLVEWLRHGLAHGNISVHPNRDRQIDELVFTCGYRNSVTKPLRFISVSPLELRRFLLAWFRLLASLKLPRQVVAEILDAREAA
jgi:hypothetical protein